MNTDRIGLLLASMLMTTAGWSPSEGQSPTTAQTASTPSPIPVMDVAKRRAVVEGTIAAIEAHYVFPERTPAIATALRNTLSSGEIAADSDPKAFANAVNDAIAAVANDRHLRLHWSADILPPSIIPGQKPDPAIMLREQAMMARRNFGLSTVEIIAGNVGYLKMDIFARAERAGPVFAAAMAFLQRADAIIFDLRENGGGDPEMVALAVSYLVPAHVEINGFHQRGQAVDDRIYSLADVQGGRWSVTKPVYVLTSKRTASGAEEFAYDLQQLKRATIVGESTWGGANPGDVFPIDQHFAVFVPTGAAVNPISKTNWEGVGVKPDVRVDAATALQTAQRMAMEGRAAGKE